MLSPVQLEKLRESLTQDRVRLLQSARQAVEFARNRDRERVGRDSLDESVDEWMYSTELRLKDREKFLLGKIQAAIKRLDNGTINECEQCEEPIGFARLSARPVTTCCIAANEGPESNEH